jgi:hypothetical protein
MERYAFLSCFLIFLLSPVGAFVPFASCQELRNKATGLYELQSTRLDLISDLPIDDELRSWSGLLEQSLVQWQDYFHVDANATKGLKATVYVIVDESKFQRNGLMTGLPAFKEGYQFGDRLYVREQPSTYYRRHLFFHEATHWVMWHLYGGGGSAWFMEGMADMQATHMLSDGKLQLGVIPSSPAQVSYWGRLRLIDETLKQTTAPTLSQILGYETVQDQTTRYAWSWAACIFFTNHPKFGPMLREVSAGKLDYSLALSQKFKARLGESWNEAQTDWNGFISDLDFGYDLSRSLVLSGERPTTKLDGSRKFELATDHGWQSSGLRVEKGRPLQFNCEGRYRIRLGEGANGEDWISEPQGVTIEYYRGNPLGCVLASIVPTEDSERTRRWETHRIGQSGTLVPALAGTLFLKINEPSSGLVDNSGTISVTIGQE